MSDRERERGAEAPCREPDKVLDPGSPGSHPGLQAAPNRCAIGAASFRYILKAEIHLCMKHYLQTSTNNERFTET